jgi:hypothetical protein
VIDCIEWEGGHWSTGYPYRVRKVSEGPGRRLIAVHRERWEQANGPIPPGRLIMHTCDNPGCINIEHLRLGTPRDNMIDKVSKGRDHNSVKTHCPNGHPYDIQVTLQSGPRVGAKYRACKECTNLRRRQRYATDPEYRQKAIERAARQRG